MNTTRKKVISSVGFVKTAGITRRALFTVFLAMFVSESMAKRSAPRKVKPVLHGGVEYRAPLSVEKMGRVQAWKEDQLLWEKKIYSVHFKAGLERDVQWVFISEMHIDHGSLIITNERGSKFSLDLHSKGIRKLRPEKGR